jgi:hypothetical protein
MNANIPFLLATDIDVARSAPMDMKVRLVVLCLSLLWLFIILRMVKNRRLWERYAIFWVYLGFLVLLLPIVVDFLDAALYGMGVDHPPSFYLLVGILGTLLILLQCSVEITTLVRRSRDSVQALAILEERVRRLEADPSAGSLESKPVTGPTAEVGR